MRCLVLGLAALALFLSEAQARDCTKECTEATGTDCLKACEAEEDQLTATDRELAVFNPTTGKPPFDPKKIIAPVVGGVIGAGALAGVIAVSVMKQPKKETPHLKAAPNEVLQPHVFQQKVSYLSAPLHVGANTVNVANQNGFRIGQNVIVDPGTPSAEQNTITGFGSLIFQNPFAKEHAAGAKIATLPTKQNLGTANPMLRGVVGTAPEDQVQEDTVSSGSTQHTVLLIAGVLGCLGLLAVCAVVAMCCMGKKKSKKKGIRPAQESYIPEDQTPLNQPAAESQYMPMGGMESQYMPVTPGIGAMPTLNAVPMQTMPPPPGMFASPYAGVGASPLANTVNALPTTAMPTTYNMGTVV